MAYDIAVVFGYSAISFIIAYLAMNIDKETHGPLQIFLIMLSFFSIWATVGAIGGILDVQGIEQLQPLNNSLITAYFWSGFFLLGYIILMLIVNIRNWVRKRNERRDGLTPSKEMRF